MRVGLEPRASAELDEAAERYERQRAGLGRELVLEVRAALRSLTNSPLGGSPVQDVDPALGVRRVQVRRFPYQVVFVTRGEEIIVIPVAHDRRRPAYRESRTDRA